MRNCSARLRNTASRATCAHQPQYHSLQVVDSIYAQGHLAHGCALRMQHWPKKRAQQQTNLALQYRSVSPPHHTDTEYRIHMCRIRNAFFVGSSSPIISPSASHVSHFNLGTCCTASPDPSRASALALSSARAREAIKARARCASARRGRGAGIRAVRACDGWPGAYDAPSRTVSAGSY